MDTDGENLNSESRSGGITPADIILALVRHKWMILFCTLLGVAGAAFIYVSLPKLFQSRAQVMVKYVPERQTVGPGDKDEQEKSSIIRGDAAVTSEAQIIWSMDLAQKVAAKIGPERILAKAGGGNDTNQAALLIHKGTIPTTPGGGVIDVSFDHPDPLIVQPVLTELLNEYVKRHWEIHRALASLDEFKQQRDTYADQLRDTELKLRNYLETNGAYALEESKKAAGARVLKIEEELRTAETDVAERETAVQYMQQQLPADAPVQNLEQREAEREKYERLTGNLQQIRRQVADLTSQYTEDSGLVQPLRERMEKLEAQKKDMEKKNPTLLLGKAQTNGDQPFDPISEKLKIALLRMKIGLRTNELVKAKAEEARLYTIEQPIVELRRKKELLEKNYRYFATELDKAQLDAGLSATRISNISRVQDPTPPVRVVVPIAKKMGMAVAAGLGFGIGLALLLELFVNQTVKRVSELDRLLPIPVYLSIPTTRRSRRFLGASKNRDQLSPAGGGGRLQITNAAGHTVDDILQPYFAALRDRILNRFETLARKPKLVGVCGCGENSGSTVTATGLAAALSESGDLKVLLVDLKKADRKKDVGLASSRKSCTLLEALEGDKRQEALIAPNLYLATGNVGDEQQIMTSPSKFTKVVPRLNASDYDYIVFDLPVVDQMSITPGLAKYMDLTLLVVEGETVPKQSVKLAGNLLLEFTSQVAIVFKDAPASVPKWLQERI